MPPEIPSQREQMETIREAESADAPSASSISQAEIDTILRQYSGRLGIFTMYQRNISAKDAVAALKREYGYSGGSHTFLDGTSGMVNYSPDTGLRLQRYQPRAEVVVKWPNLEKRIRQLIQEGSYLSPDELEKYESDHLEDKQTQGAEMQHWKFRLPKASLRQILIPNFDLNLPLVSRIYGFMKCFNRI